MSNILEFRPIDKPKDHACLPVGANRMLDFIQVDYATHRETLNVPVGELFDGFQSLKLITFSMGVPFLKDILPKFENCIAIVGCDVMVTNALHRVMAHQTHVFKDVKSDPYLVERIDAGELDVYVTNGIIAHTKVYLMSASDGRVRTVVGSANASRRAWNGSQLESYVCFDDDWPAYAAWNNRFEELLSSSSDKIVLSDVRRDEDSGEVVPNDGPDTPADASDLDDIPLVRDVKRSNHALVLELDQDPAASRYEYELRAASSAFREILPKRLSSQDGAVVLDVATIEAVKAARRERRVRSVVLKRELPRFELDYELRRAAFDGRELDLDPTSEDVRHDADLLCAYMDGFDAFIGDTERLKETYCKAMTYLFASPFIARLRYEAYMRGFDGYDWRYPAYLVITGEQSAGKTRFVNTMQRLMFGVERMRIPKEWFSPKRFREVQFGAVGIPILIDEMNASRFKYAKDIVKDEFALIEEGRIDYPTFAILSNDLRNGIDPAVAKRVFHLDVDNKMTPSAREQNELKVAASVSNMGTALYRAYVRRMFVEVDRMVASMDFSSPSVPMPDVFASSSRVLMDTFRDCGAGIPAQMKEFTWADCCGDRGVAAKAIGILNDMVQFERRALRVDRRRDVVTVDLARYAPRRREEIMANLENGLPLETKRTGESLVVCDIEALETLLETRLRRRLGPR